MIYFQQILSTHLMDALLSHEASGESMWSDATDTSTFNLTPFQKCAKKLSMFTFHFL